MEYKDLTFKVISLAKTVAEFIKTESSKFRHVDIEEKGQHNYVTYVDKGSERLLVEGLSLLIPESGFIAEEGTSSKIGSIYNWIIDPLDGTTNFIHGVPIFSISIALTEYDEVVAGVVLEVTSGECFYAWKDGGAYLNGEKIRVSERNNVADTLLATGFPYYDYSLMDSYLKLLKHFIQNTRGLRRLGSAAVDLAWVACGRFDAFYEYGLNPWDVAAGAFIVEQAGGKSTDFKGIKSGINGNRILSSNGLLHDDYLCIINQFFESEKD
jgi:myo-inositol-1(or 4)-monophosphatase